MQKRCTFNGGFTLTRRDKKVQLHDSLGRGYGKAFSSMRELSQRRGLCSFLFVFRVFLQSAGVGGGDQEKQPEAFCTCRNVAGWHWVLLSFPRAARVSIMRCVFRRGGCFGKVMERHAPKRIGFTLFAPCVYAMGKLILLTADFSRWNKWSWFCSQRYAGKFFHVSEIFCLWNALLNLNFKQKKIKMHCSSFDLWCSNAHVHAWFQNVLIFVKKLCGIILFCIFSTH